MNALKLQAVAVAVAVAAIAAGTAGAATMHPALGAKLSGMGEHGTVHLTSNATTGKVCWAFTVMNHGLTGASIHDHAGMMVAKLGPAYKAKSCTTVTPSAVRMIQSNPGHYVVWVDTKGHMGELRGTLSASMAHM
jgi:hypothetical protein